MSGGPTIARYRGLLQLPDFRRLMTAFLVDQTGSWAYSVVIALVVYERSGGSALWLAGQFAARWVTGLALSGYAGVVADRYERTRLMQVSALAAAVVMAVLTAAVVLDAPLWSLLVLSAAAAAVNSPYAPAAGALLPDVVDEKRLGTANSMFAVAENLVVVVGPALGALLLALGDPGIGLGVNTASFVVVVLLIRGLRTRSTGDAQAGASAFAQWADGLRALGERPQVILLIGYACLAEAVYGASTVIYAPLSERVGTGAHGYGYLLAAAAVGSVAAAGLADRLSGVRRVAPVLLGAALVLTVPFLVTAWAPVAGAAIALQAVSGAGYIVLTVLAMTALQRSLPGGLLGRVIGVFGALAIAATLAGSFLLTPLLAATGLIHSLEIIGGGFALIAVLAFPAARQVDRQSAATRQLIESRMSMLEALDLFADTTRPALERLATEAVEIDLADHDVLLTEGDPARELYVLVAGTLAVSAGDGARRRALPDVLAPGYVGELGLLHNRPRSATVTCRGACRLLRIDGAEFATALDAQSPSASLLTVASVRLGRTAPRPPRRARPRPTPGPQHRSLPPADEADPPSAT